MPISTRTKIAMWIFTIAAAAFFIIDTRGAFIHLRTEPWPNHAMFHAITGLFYTQALCVLVILLTWIPFRQAQNWAWWTVVGIGVAIHGGHFVGDVMTHGGLRGGGTAQGPGLIFYSLTGVALLLYLIAGALSRAHFKRA